MKARGLTPWTPRLRTTDRWDEADYILSFFIMPSFFIIPSFIMP